jgi:hypothetical protein
LRRISSLATLPYARPCFTLVSRSFLGETLRRNIITSCVLLVFVFLQLNASSLPAQTPAGQIAPKPLFRDPIHDGAADATLIWNRARREWWAFYTNRRADQATDNHKDVAWLHATRIGIAVSRDHGAHWTYKGIANIPYGKPDYTHWAPDIVYSHGSYHMLLTIVPGTFHDWNAPRSIIALESPDLEHWKYRATLDLKSERVIDPSLFHMPSGQWRLWFKDENDHSYIHYADSSDLLHWSNPRIAVSNHFNEGPKAFQWKGIYWLLTDYGKGIGVYRSSDLERWTPEPNILDQSGAIPTDRNGGHHCDVIVNGDRAFIIYFTHQAGPDLDPNLPHSAARTVLQIAELHLSGDTITVDRNAPVHVDLGIPTGDDL